MDEEGKEGGDALVLEILLCVLCMLSDGQVPLDSHVLSHPPAKQTKSTSSQLFIFRPSPRRATPQQKGREREWSWWVGETHANQRHPPLTHPPLGILQVKGRPSVLVLENVAGAGRDGHEDQQEGGRVRGVGGLILRAREGGTGSH